MNPTRWAGARIALFVMVISLPLLHADPLQNWTWSGLFPSGDPVNAVAFGQDKFVSVGNDGTIMMSPNGQNWERVYYLPSRPLNGIGYGSGLFVAVGYQAILTSTNGRDWLDHSAGIGSTLSAVTFGNGVFVAVGFGGAIYTSPNGVDWTYRLPGPAAGLVSNLPGITFVNGQFFAAGILGLISSPDGVEWTSRHTNGQFYAITHANGVIVAVGDHQSRTNLVRYSLDGGNAWLPGSAGTNGLWLRSLTYGPAGFAAYSREGSMLLSTDAQVWNECAFFPQPITPLAITSGQNLYVAGGGAVSASVWTSSNAVDWVQHGYRTSFSGIAFGNGTYVAVGNASNSFTSADGVAWERHDLGLLRLPGPLAYGNGTFVAAGTSNNVFTSTDGVLWSPQTTGTNLSLSGIAHGSNTFVIAADKGMVLSSSNAVQWQLRSTPSTNPVYNVAWTGREFIFVTAQAGFLRSSNLVQWATRQIATNSSTNFYSLSGIAYGEGQYVLVGKHQWTSFDFIVNEGVMGTSSNAVNWSLQYFPQVFGFTRVTFAYGAFVATGERGAIYTSTDGITWTTASPVTTRDLSSICFGKGGFVAVGSLNAIVQSGFHGPPVLTGVWRTPAGVELEVGAGPGQSCQLQYTDTLLPPNWQNLQSFTTLEQPLRFTNAAPPNPAHRFYRVATF